MNWKCRVILRCVWCLYCLKVCLLWEIFLFPYFWYLKTGLVSHRVHWLLLPKGLTEDITNEHLKTGAGDLIRRWIICSLFCLKLSPNGWAIFLFTLTQADRSVRQLKMLTSFWEIIWHFSSTISLLQTDAGGVPPPLWHKYLDPWYLTQVPRHCDITSYKEVLQRLRLNNRRAQGYDCLWIVSVPMQIYSPEIASKWLWWQLQCTHQARCYMTSNEFQWWHSNWEGTGAPQCGRRWVRGWSWCGFGIQLYAHRMHPRLCFACSISVDFWTGASMQSSQNLLHNQYLTFKIPSFLPLECWKYVFYLWT